MLHWLRESAWRRCVNTTDDKHDFSFIDEVLLPYASPAILDEKSIELDEKASLPDYHEIAAILNRALDYHRKHEYWGIFFFLLVAAAIVCGNINVSLLSSSLNVATLFVFAIVFLFVSLFWKVCYDAEITQLKKKINYPTWWTIYLDFCNPEKHAIKLLNKAGYKAKYHKTIDMEQFDNT